MKKVKMNLTLIFHRLKLELFLSIIKYCFLGRPSEKNLYLFNGDIVDKGSRSLECILLLFTYKLVYPYYVYLNRGNHESITLNIKNGFRDEITKKYGGEHQFDDQFILEYFGDIFRWMPIAHLINHRIFVVHGGISGSATLAVEDIRNKHCVHYFLVTTL